MLLFERPLAKEKVGVGRWTSMVLGIAGSYGKDDSVDVLYRAGGENRVAAKLRFEESRCLAEVGHLSRESVAGALAVAAGGRLRRPGGQRRVLRALR